VFIPYKAFGDKSRLPFVALTLRGPKKRAIVEAFVDSGADFSIFHAGWIDYLGLSRRKGHARSIQVGDGDSIRALLFPVAIGFYKWSFVAPIAFSKDLGPDFNLLGRQGFFNRFRFCFDDKRFRITVTRLS
jgi:hypothetical protein